MTTPSRKKNNRNARNRMIRAVRKCLAEGGLIISKPGFDTAVYCERCKYAAYMHDDVKAGRV